MRWIKRYPIVAMVMLMYLLAWPKLIADALDSYGLTQLHLSPLLDLFTGWSPGIAAFTITALVRGRKGTRELGRKMLRWRVGASWYVVVWLASAAIILAEGGAYALLTGNGTALPIVQMPPAKAAIAFFSILLLYMGVNTEEFAWRGFVLPRLQNSYGALTASLLLWVPWTLFHLPYFFTKESMFQYMGFPAFASGTLMLSILFTWLFNNTRGSLFICTLLHALLNSWPLLLMPVQSDMPASMAYRTDGAVVLLLVLFFGAARLSYRRGSHRRDDESLIY
jgi:membrane protease YdiL (CAAX protease family)